MKKILLAYVTFIIFVIGLAFHQPSNPAMLYDSQLLGSIESFDKEKIEIQKDLMSDAYQIAKQDGHNPEIVQSILLQESLAGTVKGYTVSKQGTSTYYGVMQLTKGAAKDVLSRWPGLFTKYGMQTRTEEEMKAHLILNDKFNIEVASKYLLMLRKQYGFSGRELLNAYNQGPGGVKKVGADFYYAISAEQKLRAYKARM